MVNRTIDLIRHGEPVGGRKYRGQIDDPLSEKGWEQMWRSVGDFQDWQQIVSSPLQRCAAFAQALGERHATPVAYDERFKEVGFGVWEGKTAQQLQAQDEHCVARFLADPVAHRPEGAEPLATFQHRVAQAWQDVSIHYPQQNVLVVAHAGVIRAVIAHLLDAPVAAMYRIGVSNASITRVSYVQGRPPSLTFHGERPW